MYKMLRISELSDALQTGVEVFNFIFFCHKEGKKERCLFLGLQHDLL